MASRCFPPSRQCPIVLRAGLLELLLKAVTRFREVRLELRLLLRQSPFALAQGAALGVRASLESIERGFCLVQLPSIRASAKGVRRSWLWSLGRCSALLASPPCRSADQLRGLHMLGCRAAALSDDFPRTIQGGQHELGVGHLLGRSDREKVGGGAPGSERSFPAGRSDIGIVETDRRAKHLEFALGRHRTSSAPYRRRRSRLAAFRGKG